MNEAGELILDVDASDLGIGAVLHQLQDDRERVIAYASRAVNRAERNYCITEKELLAVRFFIEHFRQYLLERKFLVRTDHQALVWLLKLKETRGKIARWIEILSHYYFSLEYRPGRKQTHCDALSRFENPRECYCPYLDTSETLKCGPCKKCMKRAQDILHESLVKESILFKPQEDAEKAPQEVVSEEVTRGVVQDEEIPGTSTDLDNRNRAVDSEVLYYCCKSVCS